MWSPEPSLPVVERAAPGRAELLAAVHHLGARRPVAARLVTLAGDPDVGAREIGQLLTADVALAARVVGLANSAAYGLTGRVRTVSFAVTTVGADVVRALAAAAAAELDGGAGVPDDFWPRCKLAAAACGELADSFGLPGAEAFCLGLLASLGQAVLWQHDPAGYAALLDGDGDGDGVRGRGRAALARAETQRYRLSHTEISAAAVASFGFPEELASALREVDQVPGPPADPGGAASPWTACLRAALEVAQRVVSAGEVTADLAERSGGVVTEADAGELVRRVTEALAESAW